MDAEVVNVPGLPAGTRFGKFVTVRPLAAGGMAELYLAAHDQADQPVVLVAIKRLLPHLGWDPEFVRMFLDEVRIAASLSHPNIVRVVDFGVGEGGHYLAMEYLHGRTLRAVQRSIRESGQLSLSFAISTVIEVAGGLHAAHEHRDEQGRAIEVVHRDVSPSNVMVTFDGQVKLLDFGIARVTEQTRLTRAGTIKGKVGYMSPEQCRGDRIDRRSDVFGLGVLLYELTVGRRAFYAENDYAVIGKVVDGDYVRPSRYIPNYPVGLEAVIAQALQVESKFRHRSAAELAQQLRRFAQQQQLELGEQARALELRKRFGVEPMPEVDLESILAGVQSSEASPRSGLRGMMLLGVGLGIGALGFVVGGSVRSERFTSDPVVAPTTAPISRPEPVSAVSTTRPGPDERLRAPIEGVEPGGTTSGEGLEDSEPVEAESEASGTGADEPLKPARTGRRRTRRKAKPKKSSPKKPSPGDNILLPPTWREKWQ